MGVISCPSLLSVKCWQDDALTPGRKNLRFAETRRGVSGTFAVCYINSVLLSVSAASGCKPTLLLLLLLLPALPVISSLLSPWRPSSRTEEPDYCFLFAAGILLYWSFLSTSVIVTQTQLMCKVSIKLIVSEKMRRD